MPQHLLNFSSGSQTSMLSRPELALGVGGSATDLTNVSYDTVLISPATFATTTQGTTANMLSSFGGAVGGIPPASRNVAVAAELSSGSNVVFTTSGDSFFFCNV